MPRGAGGDTYKPCAECGEVKLRQRDFAPRWGRCARHKHLKYKTPSYDPKCSECVSLRKSRTRQPRCLACDEARTERFSIETALKRAVREHSLDPKSTIRRQDSSVLSVTVYDLGHAGDPHGLLNELRRIANGKVELNVEPFLVADTQSELLEPMIFDQPPKGSRTHAPVYDLVATAGSFDTPGSARVGGFVETGARTVRGDFAMRVRGSSMVPLIRPRSYCVFRPIPFSPHPNALEPSSPLNGRIVLARGREELDPEEGGRLTVKRLVVPDERARVVRLEPINAEYEPLLVRADDDVQVIAQYLRMARPA
jgi:SOS-response transcriptional repressor LexA